MGLRTACKPVAQRPLGHADGLREGVDRHVATLVSEVEHGVPERIAVAPACVIPADCAGVVKDEIAHGAHDRTGVHGLHVGSDRSADGPLHRGQRRVDALTERVCLAPRRAGGVDHGARGGMLETEAFEHRDHDEENGSDDNGRDKRAIRG